MPILSVIVPVYNTEKYLHRCVDSLLQQDLKDIEIILVNDGSTDGSGAICDDYARIDGRVKVIKQDNGGLSAARNTGIAVANGKYIVFVDSDDWVDHDIFASDAALMETEQDIDICVSSVMRDYPDGYVENFFEPMKECYMARDEAIEEMMYGKHFRWEMVGKIYRHEVFNGFRAEQGITITEDLLNNWKLFLNSNRFHYSPHASYHYFYNTSSMTNLKRQGLSYDDSKLRVARSILATPNVELGPHARESVAMILRDGFAEQLAMWLIDRNKEKISDAYGMMVQNVKKVTKCFKQTEVSAIADQVKEAFIDARATLDKLSWQRDNIYIYGAGRAAGYIAAIIERMGYRCKSYVISDGQKKECSMLCGSPVIYLSQMLQESNDPIVILTTAPKHDRAVLSTIREFGLKDIIMLDKLRNLVV